MTDHDIVRLRSMLAESQDQHFSPGFADRVIERILVEDSPGAQFFVQLWPQFRRLAIGAVAASLVMGVYASSRGPVAPSPSLEQLYGLDGIQP